MYEKPSKYLAFINKTFSGWRALLFGCLLPGCSTRIYLLLFLQVVYWPFINLIIISQGKYQTLDLWGVHPNEQPIFVHANPFWLLHYSTGGTLHSLELELPGKLSLSLLQLLPTPHMLIIHILDLGFDALELGIQLQRGEKRQRQKERGRERVCETEKDRERVS